MAIGDNNVGNALKGLEDFEQVSLGPDEDMSDFETVDVSDGNVPQAQPSASNALINPEGPQISNEITPGQSLEGTTPKGVSEAAEIEQTGQDLGKVGKALANPAVQKFLGQMGVAFARGNPNEPGAILGKAGIENAKGKQVSNLAAKMLKGEEITEEDMRGVDSETLSQARSQSLAQREQARKEKATEADIEQGERGLDIEEQRVGLQERANELRERGIELDEEQFDFDKEMSEEQLLQAETELNIAERKADIRDRLATSLVKLREAEIAQMGEDAEPTPQEQARLQEARNETSQLLSEQLSIERDRLSTMESEVKSDNPDFGDFTEAFFTPGETARASQLQEELEQNTPQARQAVKRQREFVNDLEQQLRDLQQGNTEESQDTGGGDTDTEVVTVESQEDLEGLSPGTRVQNPNGVQGVVKEDGTIEW